MNGLWYVLLYLGITAEPVFEPHYAADLPNPAVAISHNESGEFTEVIIKEWHDSVYTQTGHINYIFQQGYDYRRKEGFIRTYTPNRELVNETYSFRNDGGMVREEMMLAFEIFKQDPVVLNLLTAVDSSITLHGGFNYLDDHPSEPCYSGNRCVHVFASTPDIPVLAHAIVRLTDKSVPYPTFDTDGITRETIQRRMQRINLNRGKL